MRPQLKISRLAHSAGQLKPVRGVPAPGSLTLCQRVECPRLDPDLKQSHIIPNREMAKSQWLQTAQSNLCHAMARAKEWGLSVSQTNAYLEVFKRDTRRQRTSLPPASPEMVAARHLVVKTCSALGQARAHNFSTVAELEQKLRPQTGKWRGTT